MRTHDSRYVKRVVFGQLTETEIRRLLVSQKRPTFARPAAQQKPRPPISITHLYMSMRQNTPAWGRGVGLDHRLRQA